MLRQAEKTRKMVVVTGGPRRRGKGPDVVLVPWRDLADLAELYFGDGVLPCCAVCYRDKGQPHASGCWLALALDLPRSGQGEEV